MGCCRPDQIAPASAPGTRRLRAGQSRCATERAPPGRSCRAAPCWRPCRAGSLGPAASRISGSRRGPGWVSPRRSPVHRDCRWSGSARVRCPAPPAPARERPTPALTAAPPPPPSRPPPALSTSATSASSPRLASLAYRPLRGSHFNQQRALMSARCRSSIQAGVTIGAPSPAIGTACRQPDAGHHPRPYPGKAAPPVSHRKPELERSRSSAGGIADHAVSTILGRAGGDNILATVVWISRSRTRPAGCRRRGAVPSGHSIRSRYRHKRVLVHRWDCSLLIAQSYPA